MRRKTEIKKVKNLSKKEMDLMNSARIKEFGKKEVKDWKRDYPLTTDCFLVRDDKKIAAFGLFSVIPYGLAIGIRP